MAVVTPLPERPRVDVGALGGTLYNHAVDAVAQTVVQSMDWLEEDGRELNQLQKIELVSTALISTAGLERQFLVALRRELQESGVETCNDDA